ncbi:hypothetical protein DCAR_0727436 [Daucus carota subsp. sativus]|uniref:Late embryogenesis abundant protein LEA-2 subgroup domain-containing protein n=1 Tax=Daucus carota subsp. sativus TaxID=79200 RepID=A0A164SX51_DAUCS|nr:hypothetical protein DCAR_0727436 [Daucus carota subsp. sativus]
MNGDRSSLRSGVEGYTSVNITDAPSITVTPPRHETKSFNWNLLVDILSLILFFLLMLYCGSQVYLHRKDQVHKHDFVIDSIVTSPYNQPTNNKINSAWNLTFNVTNKSNSSTFFYENVGVTIFYGDQIVWATMLPNFFQRAGERNGLKMAMISSIFADGAKGFTFGDRRLDMSSGIDVKLVAMVTEHKKALSPHMYQVVVLCPGIQMKFDSGHKFQKFIGPARQCEVITA